MSVTPKDIFSLAQRLSEIDDCEASRRSSVSRAYYAVFHEAICTLPKNEIKLNLKASKTSHDDVISAYEALGRNPGVGRSHARQVARGLSSMKTMRKEADYSISTDFTSEKVNEALLKYSNLTSDLESFFKALESRETRPESVD